MRFGIVLLASVRVRARGSVVFPRREQPHAALRAIMIVRRLSTQVTEATAKYVIKIRLAKTGRGRNNKTSLFRDDDKITIRSRNRGYMCTVPYDELRRSFEDFAKEVREMLVKEAPELTKHSYWRRWFRGEVKTPWRDWQDE